MAQRTRDHAPRTTRRALSLTCAAAIAALSACDIAPKATGNHRAGTNAASTAFEPVELRIHPLTRIRHIDGQTTPSVDLYFELLDRFGHGVKSLGTLSVELRAVGVGGQREPFQVRTWTVELTDPATNSNAFDRVTRTYHLTLADVPTGEAGATLRIRFRSGRGRDISATFALESPHGS